MSASDFSNRSSAVAAATVARRPAPMLAGGVNPASPNVEPGEAAAGHGTLSLAQFEKIDGLRSQLLVMGDFLKCDDPRHYVRVSQRLLDACLDAGMSHDEPDHEAWADAAVARALVSQ